MRASTTVSDETDCSEVFMCSFDVASLFTNVQILIPLWEQYVGKTSKLLAEHIKEQISNKVMENTMT